MRYDTHYNDDGGTSEMRLVDTSTAWTISHTAICPDLLRLSDIGEADSWRGRLVRGFFRLLRWVTGV